MRRTDAEARAGGGEEAGGLRKWARVQAFDWFCPLARRRRRRRPLSPAAVAASRIGPVLKPRHSLAPPLITSYLPPSPSEGKCWEDMAICPLVPRPPHGILQVGLKIQREREREKEKQSPGGEEMEERMEKGGSEGRRERVGMCLGRSLFLTKASEIPFCSFVRFNDTLLRHQGRAQHSQGTARRAAETARKERLKTEVKANHRSGRPRSPIHSAKNRWRR